jgi:non-ribosomal peptide synthetase component F/acyl carrier protein/pyruvate-formate lyase-activating enzyme
MEALNKNISGELQVVSQQFAEEERYWLETFSGKLVRSGIPGDHRQKGERRREMETVTFSITGEEYAPLKKISAGSDPKLHMILTAVLAVLLEKYTENSDIIIATPIYKQDIDAEFINTVLPLRILVEGKATFKEIILKVRDIVVEADRHQNYSIDMMLQKLKIPYSGGDHPLFETALMVENIHHRKYLEPIPLNIRMRFERTAQSLEGELEYNAAIYSPAAARRIAGHYTVLMNRVLQNIDRPVEELEMMTEEEKHRLQVEFNDTDVKYGKPGPLHRQFEEQAARTPENIALRYTEPNGKETAVTYRQLDQRSNRLARYMGKNGIHSETVVGIMMQRSVRQIEGLLGILKAGGAYLPIDPGLPSERVSYMLKNADAHTLLTDAASIEATPFTDLQGIPENTGVQVAVTPIRPHIKEFDALPTPDRTYLDLRNYKNKIGMASVTNCISIQTTRGCPYECLYCHKIWSKKHVHRSAENIFEEVQYYYNNGVTNFAVIDDCFNLNLRESSKLFEMIRKKKMKLQIFFPNGLRGDIMTPEYIDQMVEAGTRGINLSLETASPRLQKLLKKHLHLENFKRVVEYIAAAHPNVILEMATMHGFPSETEEEAMMTLNFIKDIKWLHFPYIHILKIFPNTEMEAFALEHGISKSDIMASRDRAFHELPETLPFPKSFTRKYQANFLNEYFLDKDRLKHVLPVQMEVLSEEALAQKYNAYLPTEIKNLQDIIEFTGIDGIEIPDQPDQPGQPEQPWQPEQPSDKILGKKEITIFDRPKETREPGPGARRLLFLDLSQHFSTHKMLYRVVEQPLGELYLMAYLKQRFGEQVDGRVYKSGNDFDSYEELRATIEEYKPELIGIRTLTFFKEFFHETVSLIRQWGYSGHLFSGGPYASSDYDTILKDPNIDLVVRGEGEYTMGELVEAMLQNQFKLPTPERLSEIRGIAYRTSTNDVDRTRRVLVREHIDAVIAEEETAPLEPQCTTQNLAYVMYTSGSTGKPKGVMVEHRQVNNCIAWMQDKFKLNESAVIAQRTNLTFDPSVWEIFWPLAVGGSVKLVNQQQSRDAEYLLRLMSDGNNNNSGNNENNENDENNENNDNNDRNDKNGSYNVTMMYCPAPLVTGMTYLLNSKATFENIRLTMPWLIIGAEAIGKEVVNNFYRYYEGKIVNTYGPTECAINNTYYDLERDDPRTFVPIGKPIANNRIYILSAQMKPAPIAVPGEITIAGHSVVRGYINNEAATDANFIENPFGEGKLYKTGDIGRWLEDGNIEIMGRTDEQVKIRGYRIELGEIKTALARHENIRDCVVTIGDMNAEKESPGTLRTCKKCGITSQYPRVKLNEEGICGICTDYPGYKEHLDRYFRDLDNMKLEILEANKDKTSPYDCLLLYNGGRGAAYALYRLKEMGLQVQAVSYDNGYLGKAALKRIKEITGSLNVAHEVLTHQNSDKILAESLKTAHTVCRGCYLLSSSLAAQYAHQHGIKIVVGATLSRGQIIDNKLFMFLQQGITDPTELDSQVSKFQRGIAEIEKNFFDLIDIEDVRNGTVYDTVKFMDFYRYTDITNQEMIDYLNRRNPYWKTGNPRSIYSTNCPIKQIGDYAHQKERDHHFYGAPTSWEKRLGHLDLKNVKEDLQCRATQKGYENFLKRINYKVEAQLKKDGKYLCAYYVPEQTGDGAETSPGELGEELKKHLQRELPEYMVPTYYVPIQQIPLTSNGKLDRHALPKPNVTRTKPRANYVAPETGMEKLIAGLWKEVLQLERVGINDNFFDLGGNSLNIIEVNSKLQEQTGMDIPIVAMFTHSTIRKLVQNLEQHQQPGEKEVMETKRKKLVDEGKNMMKQTFSKFGG